MPQKELPRYNTMKNLIDENMNGFEASKQINLILGKVKNIKVRIIEEGVSGVIHKNRERESNSKIPESKINKIESVVRGKYFEKNSLPLSIYLNKYSAYKINLKGHYLNYTILLERPKKRNRCQISSSC